MHTALWKLYRLRIRGELRSMAGKLKSVRGAVLAVFTLLVLGMMLGPNLVMAFKLGRAWRGWASTPIRSARWSPSGCSCTWSMSIVTSLGERAIYFSPSDVDFLFPAPFSRRQILLYKILGSVTAAVFIALVLPDVAGDAHSFVARGRGRLLSGLADDQQSDDVRPVHRPERRRTGFYPGPQIAPGGSDRGCRRGAGPGGQPRARRPLAGDVAAGAAFAGRPKSCWRPSRCSPRSSPPSD